MRIGLSLGIAIALAATAGVPAAAQQNNGRLKTSITPGSAGVFVDGKYVGPARNFGASRNYALPPGEYEIRLAEPRYEDFVTKVSIQQGRTMTLTQTMKPLPVAKPPFGVLRTVAFDKFEAVYVNGRFMGHADEFNNPFQGLKLNPGEYIVKIVPAGSEQGREERVTIETDRTTILRSGR
jgi:hypothetical protein